MIERKEQMKSKRKSVADATYADRKRVFQATVAWVKAQRNADNALCQEIVDLQLRHMPFELRMYGMLEVMTLCLNVFDLNAETMGDGWLDSDQALQLFLTEAQDESSAMSERLRQAGKP
jgi:hypothetical protein